MKYSYLHIRNLRDRGASWREIARVMGCCKNTVRRALIDDIDSFNEDAKERQQRYRKRLRNAPER